MRFASLGSGSEGNALVVEVGATRVMVDCGFGLRETVRRLACKGLTPDAIDAIVITHEHGDHIGGAAVFARKYGIPVWLTRGTLAVFRNQCDNLPEVRAFDSHTAFAIGDVEIQPFPVPHDAREPVQFVFGDGSHRMGLLTDVGATTPHIEAMLTRCDALVLECNHDASLLQQSGYPPGLKRRIAGQYGHLDNHAAAHLLSRLDNSRLQHLIAAHLSKHNNTPELALQALSAVLDNLPTGLAHATQEDGFDWRTLQPG
jgi:phosphoribosyl 1,2-cyclic phosphodiesterase